jgi:hypothetical protein
VSSRRSATPELVINHSSPGEPLPATEPQSSRSSPEPPPPATMSQPLPQNRDQRHQAGPIAVRKLYPKPISPPVNKPHHANLQTTSESLGKSFLAYFNRKKRNGRPPAPAGSTPSPAPTTSDANLSTPLPTTNTSLSTSSSSNVVGVHYRVGKKIGDRTTTVIFDGVNLLNNQKVAILFVRLP